MPINRTQQKIIGQRYLSGESIGVIASEFGVSRQRIYQIARDTGRQRPHIQLLREKVPPPERAKPGPKGHGPQIIALRETGHSYTFIALYLGIGTAAVGSALRRWRPELTGKINPGGRIDYNRGNEKKHLNPEGAGRRQ